MENKANSLIEKSYITFIDHPLVTIEMAREFAKVLEEEYAPFEEEFLESKLPEVLKGNQDSLIAISSPYQLGDRLREIISISDEFNYIYRDNLVAALYKQAMEGLSERIQFISNGYTIHANREFQMAVRFMRLATKEFLSHMLQVPEEYLLEPNNREEVVEKIRLLIAGVIWTQTNVGRCEYSLASDAAGVSARESLNLRWTHTNPCSEVFLPNT